MSNGRQSIILVVSEKMTTNKKQDRHEHNLIRMPALTRNNLSIKEDGVVLTRNNTSCNLNVYKAFSADILELKKQGISKADLCKIGFVTRDTFKKFTNAHRRILKSNIFISPHKPHKRAPFKMLIGADPEFLLFNDDGNVVRANNILQKPGLIGSDGAMTEVRPYPHESPADLVDSIHDIFSNTNLTNKIEKYVWKAAVYYKDDQRDYPVGGHIHLGNPPDINTYMANNEKLYLFAVFNKIMDELLAIPLIKLDGTDLGKARRSECEMAMGNKGYGFYGEWRACDGRLEYRTLSGLWLAHPVLSNCVLGTAKVIAEEIYKRAYDEKFATCLFKHPEIELNHHKLLYNSDFDDWKNIPIANELNCTKSSNFMTTIINTSDANSITAKYLKNWYTEITRLTTYKKYAECIDMLYNILQMPQEKFDTMECSIKKNWLEGGDFLI